MIDSTESCSRSSAKGYSSLRKIRLRVPSLNCGKSRGYRVIYTVQYVDEVTHIVFLACYFKGDDSDLPQSDYKSLELQGAAILASSETEWETGPVLPA